MSIINEESFLNPQTIGQLASSNCVSLSGCYPYVQPIAYYPGNRELKVEAVEGGYIITGHFKGKGPIRTVATDAKGLAEVVANWTAP